LASEGATAAVGEVLLGAGRPYWDVVYVTFFTGVGVGVMLDGQLAGRLVRARRSLGGTGDPAAQIVVSQASPGDHRGLVGPAGWNEATGVSR